MTLAEDIGRLEGLVAVNDRHEVARACIDLLYRIEQGNTWFGAPTTVGDAATRDATRLADAIKRLLDDDRYSPTATEVRRFILLKRAVSTVFELSDYRDMSCLQQRFARPCPDAEPASVRRRMLMGASVNTANPSLLEMLSRCPAKSQLLTILALLSEYLVWSAGAEDMRTRLLTWTPLPGPVKLDRFERMLLASVWMACSYAQTAHKHGIKAHLNGIVRDWLAGRGVTDRDNHRAPLPAGRPTLLIIAETYQRGHAMDRCFRPSIRALRRQFRTVLMSASGDGDPGIDGLVDAFDPEPFDPRQPELFLQRARMHDAAVVYLPSVGMRLGGIAAANVRLAPIQIAGTGHPATTRSACVDYVIMADEDLTDPGCYSETLLLRPSLPRYIAPAAGTHVAATIRERPATVRLAVPAWVRKLTPAFLATCAEIARRAERPIEFWFFPNVTAALYQAVRRRLTTLLPARVFPTTGFQTYIRNLNATDLHLSTFPFGSTNGVVDSLRQGLPVISMGGAETHSIMDQCLTQQVNQPDWLTVADTAGYADAVLRLVHDDELRVAISRDILTAAPDRRFFVADSAETGDMADMIDAVYRHHEVLQATGRKVWHHEDLLALNAGP